MGKKVLFLFVLILSVVLILDAQEHNYNLLFKNINKYLAPIDLTEIQSQSMENNKELAEVLENGLNFSSLLIPYAKANVNLKSILENLASFKLTLRSAKNIQIYQNAVRSIVLVVAPEIGSGAGFIINKKIGVIATNFHVTCGLKDLWFSSIYCG